MKIRVLYFLSFLILHSCSVKDTRDDRSVLRTQESKEILHSESQIHPAAGGSKFADFRGEYYAVYRYSDSVTAIAVGFRNYGRFNILDSLFEVCGLNDELFNSLHGKYNCKLVDSSGPFKIYKSEQFEKLVRELLPDTFYLYGLESGITCSPGNILFNLDECRINSVLITLMADGIKNAGEPLIASTNHLDLVYGNNYVEVDSLIRNYEDNLQLDYTDSIRTRVFAHHDSVCFAFSDNFDWYYNLQNSKCYFPSRGIYVSGKDGHIRPVWGYELDLFGIPCD